MKGYVAQRRGRFYAVIYQGRDPITGKERRSWHPAGTNRAEAERLAAKLAAEETERVDAVRSLTFGAYLTSREPRPRRKLTPEEKWQVFLEVTSREITQADAARKHQVDVSVIIGLRRLARDASIAAFTAAKPGRPSMRDYEVEALQAENARLSEAIKELAIELSLVWGKQRSA